MSSLSDSRQDREQEKFDIRNNRRVVNVYDPTKKSTPYNEALTVRRKILFELSAAVPTVSILRNEVIVDPPESDSNVTRDGGEFKVEALPNSTIIFESGERGRYKPGYESQAGIGVRIPNQELTGDSEIEWGYFQGSDGLGFGLDAQGFYIFKNKNGSKVKTRQGDFSVDNLNGKGPSQYNLDLSDGLIFQIDFSWYGYGAVKWSVIIKSDDPQIGDYEQVIHRFAPQGETLIDQPNLHVSCSIKNDQAEPLEAYVGGRQFSILGDYDPQFRVVGNFRGSRSGIGTTFVPLISFRRKSEMFTQLAQSVKIRSSSIITQGNIIFGYVFNGELTGASFSTPIGCCPDETTLESDTSATAITGGIAVGPRSLGVEGQGNRSTLTRDDDFTFDLIDDKIITLVARSVTGNVTIDAATMNMTEDW